MADKNLLAQMLENLVNDDQAKAEELFHEYVVSASREIYEELIESEISDEEVDEAADDDEEKEDKKVDEEFDEEVDESSDEDLDENFEDIAYEGDDEMPGDATDDLEGDLGMGDEEGGEHSEKSEEELFQDLDSIVDELQAKFDELKGHEAGEDEFGGEEGDEEMEGFGDEPQLATVREYVEKVPGGHGAEKKGGAEGQLSGTGSQSDKPSVNTKSIVAGKNDMGGTASNIAQSKEDAVTLANQGQLKGNGLAKGTTKEENFGNINVPGGKAGNAFSKKEPGHGAEKKGGGEGVLSGTGAHSDKPSVNSQSLFRGRR